jgi:hypothetical protein
MTPAPFMRATPVLDINPILDRFAAPEQLTSHASFHAIDAAARQALLRGEDDTKTKVRPVSALFAQDQPEDGQAPQSRDLQDARGSREARARRAVFQTRRLTKLHGMV